MAKLLTTSDFRLAVVTKSGLRMLSVLEEVATERQLDLVLTAGTNGVHSGPLDPHYLGNALDVRLLDLPVEQRTLLVSDLASRLGPAFTCLHELPGATLQTTAEHLHVQLKKGLSELPKELQQPPSPS